MYQEKQSRYNKKRTNKRKAAVLLTSLVLVLVCAVGATVAYLVDTTSEVVNTFDPAKVSCEVTETFENDVKTDVAIKNTSDIKAYIRAAIIVTWKNKADDELKNGDVYGRMPVAGMDYTISLNDTDWFLGTDGYYYHKKPVPPESQDGETEVLIYNCSPVAGKAPEGYGLNVEILGSAIQSVPVSVVETYWPAVQVVDDQPHGNLAAATS